MGGCAGVDLRVLGWYGCGVCHRASEDFRFAACKSILTRAPTTAPACTNSTPQGHALHGTIRELAAAEKAARAAAEGAAAEADEARLAVAAAQRQAAEVAAQLAHSRSEIELYTQEIEVRRLGLK